MIAFLLRMATEQARSLICLRWDRSPIQSCEANNEARLRWGMEGLDRNDISNLL